MVYSLLPPRPDCRHVFGDSFCVPVDRLWRRIWLIGAILNRAASVVIALGVRTFGMCVRAQYVSAFVVVMVVIVIGASIRLAPRLGLPTYSLLADEALVALLLRGQVDKCDPIS